MSPLVASVLMRVVRDRLIPWLLTSQRLSARSRVLLNRVSSRLCPPEGSSIRKEK